MSWGDNGSSRASTKAYRDGMDRIARNKEAKEKERKQKALEVREHHQEEAKIGNI